MFKKDSWEDLVLRGFPRGYVLEHTGFDPGYRNSNIRGKFDDVNKIEYIAHYIQDNFSEEEILSILSDSDDLATSFGLYGKRIPFPTLFSIIGLSDIYKKSVNIRKQRKIEESNLKKYGVRRPMQSKAVQKKAKQTCMQKYGTEHAMQNEHIKQKTKKTVQARYGQDNVMKVPAIADTLHQTMIDRYGAAYPLQNDIIKQKAQDTVVSRYHVLNVAHLPEIKQKKEETCIVKYGADNPAKSKDIIAKAMQTNMERYGVAHPLQNDAIKQKSKDTCLLRYGVPYFLQSSIAQKKAKQTNMERYGVDNVMKNPEIQEKVKQTCMMKYGVPSPLMSPEIRQKIEKTCMDRYGVKHPMQSSIIMQRIINHNIDKYGVSNPMQSSIVKQHVVEHNMDKYGVPNPMQCQSVVQKASNTKRINGTFNTSKPEKKLKQLLIAKFGEDDVKTQYNADPRYPFHCDFYIPSRDIFIELNASWTHGDHFFDENNPDDVVKLKHLQAAPGQYYKNVAYNWSVSDVKKRNIAIENHLKYVVFWKNDLSDAVAWLETGCKTPCFR